MKLKVIVIAVAAALSTGAFAADEAKKDTKAGGKDSAPVTQQQQGAKNGGSASAGSSSAGNGSASAGASGKQAGQQRNAEGSGDKAMSRGAGQAHSADMVKQVQQSLKDKGIDAGPVDGKFGPLTQKGVKQFQEQQKLQATGRLDQQTLSALGVSGSASAGAGQAAPAKDGAKASGGASAGASGQAAPAKDGAKASGSASGGASAGSSGSADAKSGDAKSGNGASASGAAGASAPKAPKDAGEQARSGSSNDGSAGSGLPAGGDPGAASSGAGTPGSAAPAPKKPKPGTTGGSSSGM